MEYKFEKDYLYSINPQGELTLISKTAIRSIRTISLINLDRRLYRVEVLVYFNNLDNGDHTIIFAKNFESLAELEENLKIQSKFILENWQYTT